MSKETKFNSNGKGILCFGELLLRICPDTNGDWLKENNLPCYVGGAELNVASALSLWELPTSYFTALPDNLMARQLESYIQEKRIDTSAISFQGKRIGVYYLPKGEDVKHAGVIYDREHSAFAELQQGKIDWEKVFEGITWFHFSAICPAVSESVAQVCEEALIYASKKGIFVSLDLNYRAKLWQYGKQPIEVMPGLAQYCDLIMGNVWAAELMLGIPVAEDFKAIDHQQGYLEQAELTSREIVRKFPKCKAVGNTYRFDYKEKGVRYYTTLFAENRFYHSAEYTTEYYIDKVGSGDCFMAGLIYGFYQDNGYQETLDFATAAAFNKLFIASDATSTKVAAILGLIKPAPNQPQ
jgi:2-dehydro-3-deoxygluconokinase